MGFNVSLSGINAANTDLSVTANNVANVNTTGFAVARRVRRSVRLHQLWPVEEPDRLGCARPTSPSSSSRATTSRPAQPGHGHFR